MYQILLIGVLVAVSFGAPPPAYDARELAESCNEEACRLPNCRCSSTQIPGGLTALETPQVTYDIECVFAKSNA